MIKKIPGIQHKKVPGNIEIFHPTGIKDKSNVKLSFITYKGNKSNIHHYNNKVASFLHVRAYTDIIKYH